MGTWVSLVKTLFKVRWSIRVHIKGQRSNIHNPWAHGAGFLMKVCTVLGSATSKKPIKKPLLASADRQEAYGKPEWGKAQCSCRDCLNKPILQLKGVEVARRGRGLKTRKMLKTNGTLPDKKSHVFPREARARNKKQMWAEGECAGESPATLQSTHALNDRMQLLGENQPLLQNKL